MPILKLDKEDEEKKIAFELNYLRSLTVRQRFLAMWKKSEEIRSLLKGRGYRKTVEIIKRDRKGLIEMKKAAARPQDLADLKYLIRLKEKSRKRG